MKGVLFELNYLKSGTEWINNKQKQTITRPRLPQLCHQFQNSKVIIDIIFIQNDSNMFWMHVTVVFFQIRQCSRTPMSSLRHSIVCCHFSISIERERDAHLRQDSFVATRGDWTQFNYTHRWKKKLRKVILENGY